MSVISVNKNNFDSVKSGDKTVLLDFYADWCGPCRMVSPLVDEIAEENPQYVVGKINVDNEPELAQAFGVMSIPTLVVMKNGKNNKSDSGSKTERADPRYVKGLIYAGAFCQEFLFPCVIAPLFPHLQNISAFLIRLRGQIPYNVRSAHA